MQEGKKFSKTAIINVICLILLAFILGTFTPRFAQYISPAKTQNILQMSVVNVHDDTNSLYKFAIEYPQFIALPDEFNASISGLVSQKLADFKKTSSDNWQARIATASPGSTPEIPKQPFYFSVGWEPKQINSRFVTFILRISSFDGGANGREELSTFNYDVSKGKVVALADLFPQNGQYLKAISDASRQQLIGDLNISSGGHAPVDMIWQETEPNENNFKNFTFDDNMLQMYFPKYQVAPGVFGEEKVILQRSAINTPASK